MADLLDEWNAATPVKTSLSSEWESATPIKQPPTRTNELSWRQGRAPSLMERLSDMFGEDTAAQSAKATNALAYSEMFKISPSKAYDLHDEISQQVKDKLATEKIHTEKKGMASAINTGIDNSIVGMILRQKPATPFESASQTEQWVNGIVNTLADTPIYQLGYLLGGGNPVSGTAGAFGFHAGLRKTLMDRYSKGEVKNAGELFERMGSAAKEALKGEVVGGFVGGAGTMAPVWMAKMAPGIEPSIGWKASVELATMTAAGKLIEGQLPTTRDLVDNAATILVLHSVSSGFGNMAARKAEVRQKLQDVYVETGVHPKEIQQIISSEPINPKEDVIDKIDRVAAEIKQTLPPEPIIEQKAEPTKGKGQPEIVEPAPSSQEAAMNLDNKGVAEVVPEIKLGSTPSDKVPREKGAQNMETRIIELGGIKHSDDYNTKLLKEDVNKKVINNKNGMAPDAMANQLIKEGFPIESADQMVEMLKDQSARTVFVPEKSEALSNRKAERQTNEWANEQARLAEEGIDTRTIGTVFDSHAEALRRELIGKGYSPEDVDTALGEIKNNLTAALNAPPIDTSITSTTNKAVNAERAAAGLPPIESPVNKRTIEGSVEDAKAKVDSGEINPRELARKINNLVEMTEHPGEYNNDLTRNALLYDKAKIKAEQKGLQGNLIDAESMQRFLELQDAFDANQRATKALASEWGYTGRAMQNTMAEDYSLSAMLRNAKEDGIEITPAVIEKYDKLSKKIEKAQEAETGVNEQGASDNFNKTIEIIKNEEKLTQRKQKRQVKKEELDVEFDNLINTFAKEHSSTFSSNAFTDPARYKFLIDLTRNRVKAGLIKAEDIVDSIHTSLTNVGISFSKREIQDTIARYGVTKEMSKDEIDIQVREIKRQMQLLSALDDAKKGTVPEKSGLKHDPKSDRVRELTREVTQAMRENGIDSKNAKSPEEQWKTSLDAVISRLKNSIADNVKRMETGKAEAKKLGIEYNDQANDLVKINNKIKEVLEFAENKGKKEVPPEQRIRAAVSSTEKSIAEYERRINDLENGIKSEKKTSKTPETPELKKLRAERDLLKDLEKTLKDELTPKKTPEQQATDRFVKLRKGQLAEYKRRIEEGDFSKKEKKEPFALVPDKTKAEFSLDQSKKEYEKARLEDMLANRSTAVKIKDGMFESMNLIKAIKSAYDVSAPGRQAAFYVLSHPIQGFRDVPTMFRAMKSEEAMFRVNKEISEMENFKNGNYKEAGIDFTESGGGKKAEEMYRSRWAEKVPGIPMSERAFTAYLNLARAHLFDSMYKFEFSNKVATKADLQALGAYVNTATGRGTLKGYENALQGLGSFIWAPKLVLSRFQMALGKDLMPGGGRTAGSRKAVAMEYARILGSLATIYAVNSILNDKEVETDALSSDFGKIIVGNTRIDPLAGVSQVTVFMDRIVEGAKKSITTGEITDLAGDNVPYGGGDIGTTIWRFMQTKLTPVLGLAISLRQGKNLIGEPMTMYDIPEEVLIPLSVKDIYQAMNEEGIPAGMALGTLGIFGVGIQTHEQKGASR